MMHGDNPPPPTETPPLSLFELPAGMVKPAVMACRFFNSTLDEIFYDVPTLRADFMQTRRTT